MRKAIRSITASLDGLMASDDGDLSRPPQPTGSEDYGDAEFFAGVSIIATAGQRRASSLATRRPATRPMATPGSPSRTTPCTSPMRPSLTSSSESRFLL
jgi:hypothetical protein